MYIYITNKSCILYRVENGRERSGKHRNHSRSCIIWPGTVAGTGKPDGKTNSILRDIGNGILRSGTCRLRSGIDNTKRKHRYTCNHLKQLARRNNCNHALKHIRMKLWKQHRIRMKQPHTVHHSSQAMRQQSHSTQVTDSQPYITVHMQARQPHTGNGPSPTLDSLTVTGNGPGPTLNSQSHKYKSKLKIKHAQLPNANSQTHKS